MINYNNRKFRPIENSANSETAADTVFHYKQEGKVVTASYSGGTIVKGHLIGLVDENGHIAMSYHQVNTNGELMTGNCYTTPSIDLNGKIKLFEEWQWTSGDKSKGKSVLVEV